MTVTRYSGPRRYPRTYRLQVSLILAPVIGALSGVAAVVLTEEISIQELLWFLSLSLIFGLLVSAVLVSIRYVLHPDRIVSIKVFRKTELKRHAIRGYRTEERRKGLRLTLEPVDPAQKAIKIATAFFRPDATFDGWMAGIRKLD